MNRNDFKKLTEKEKREYAKELLFSHRGTWLIGKAIDIALKEMSKAKRKEPSDIADMEILRDNMFPIYHLTEMTADEFRKMRKGELEKIKG